MNTTTTEMATDRAQRLSELLAAREVDLLLVSEPVNLRYVTHFTGSNGLALVGAEGARRFFTDFRYDQQSAAQVPDSFQREIVSGTELLDAVVRTLPSGGATRLGFDDGAMTVQQHAALAASLPEGVQLVPCAGAVESLRQIKEPGELETIAAAAALIDDLMEWVAERGLAGRTERGVAVELEYQMRLRGAQAPSFPSIVASGAHGSLPHAEPRAEEIPRGVLVTIDMGAKLDGYCSDCTRTFATGPLDDEARGVYELVLTAQKAAVEAVRAGASTRAIDSIARDIISEAGHGDHFGHGLGHAVGLDIHESPRFSPSAPDATLVAGNVMTVEPGVYLPGRLGVRIEDLVVVTDDGCDIYSRFRKDLLILD